MESGTGPLAPARCGRGSPGRVPALRAASATGETARLAGAALALAALVFSGYLLLVQIFAIGAFCQWCLVNDAIVALLAAAAVARLAPSGCPAPRRRRTPGRSGHGGVITA